jgi:hypothetical protein
VAEWAEPALARFADPQVAAVTPLIRWSEEPGTIVSAGISHLASGRLCRLAAGREELPSQLGKGPDGPDTWAGFYRRSALDSVGRLAEEFGDLASAADLALALRQAGFRCVLEPESQVRVSRAAEETLPEPSFFAKGFDGERLFWRWASATGWLRSLTAHGLLVGGECLQSLVRPAMICQLAGRTAGAVRAALPWGSKRNRQANDSAIPSTIRPPQFAAPA